MPHKNYLKKRAIKKNGARRANRKTALQKKRAHTKKGRISALKKTEKNCFEFEHPLKKVKRAL